MSSIRRGAIDSRYPSGCSTAVGSAATKITASDVPPVEVCPGYFRKTLVWGKELMIVRFDIEKDKPMPEHSHPHEQAGVVVSGAIEMTIDGKKQLCEPGCSYVIPGKVLHSAFSIEDTVVIDAFSPPREEYVPEERAQLK